MARIRTIKPEFWTDSLMVQFDAFTRLLYIGLWTAADDHGAIKDEPDRIAMEIMPRESPEEVKANIDLLIACGRLSRMINDDGSSYLLIDKWLDHQRVDKPAKSKIIREGSRKLAIPLAARREVATKYGCSPGENRDATCYFCGEPGVIHWHKLRTGKPSSWVSFSELELDHFQPESKNGDNSSRNLVLSCRRCNRSRCNKSAFDFVTSNLVSNIREDSREFLVGKEGKGKDQGKDKTPLNVREENSQPSAEPPPDDQPPFPLNGNNFGKFQMFEGWTPGQDFVRSASIWGRSIGEGYSPPELAEFVTYWIAEGKMFQQSQWEQKFAQSIVKRRAIESKSKPGVTNERIQQPATTGGRAVEKIRAAIAAEREREGLPPMGNNGRDVFGSVGGEERDSAIIDLESGNWRTE